VDTDNESLSSAVDDNTLSRLAFFLASALDIGGTSLSIINFTAGEGISV